MYNRDKCNTISFRCDDIVKDKLDKIFDKVDSHIWDRYALKRSKVIVACINYVSRLNLDDKDVFLSFWGSCRPDTFKGN